ncbi:MAG TPA: SDR family NAD(P)-dependent oxidoreductase [bacterium]|nr:SDR family NAD(P)-dependent oxidoreductase [bacterium]
MIIDELAGKIVVLTGASSGFGRGAALRFAEAGSTVILAARRDQLLDELAEECNNTEGQALAVPTDVSRPEDVEALALETLDKFGHFDIWINDAGVGAIGPFEKIPLADHTQVIETDLLGTLYGSYYAYRQFLQQGSGILINIASEVGKGALPYYSSYTAAKHGVVGLGKSLRHELQLNHVEDVHVCTVMPTAFDTPFFEHAANYSGHEIEGDDPAHDPTMVIDTILNLAQNPKDQKLVSADGIVQVLLKTVAPAVAEKMDAKATHEEIVEAPPAPKTSGALRRPISRGTGIRGEKSKR